MDQFNRMSWMFVVIPGLLTVAGLYVIGNGVWTIVKARRFLRGAEQVTGVVSDHRFRVKRGSERDRLVTVPVLRFETRNGKFVETEQALALQRRVPDRGAEVGVLYDPADPKRAAVAGSTSGVTLESVYAIVFGVVFTVFSSNFLSPWLFRLL